MDYLDDNPFVRTRPGQTISEPDTMANPMARPPSTAGGGSDDFDSWLSGEREGYLKGKATTPTLATQPTQSTSPTQTPLPTPSTPSTQIAQPTSPTETQGDDFNSWLESERQSFTPPRPGLARQAWESAKGSAAEMATKYIGMAAPGMPEAPQPEIKRAELEEYTRPVAREALGARELPPAEGFKEHLARGFGAFIPQLAELGIVSAVGGPILGGVGETVAKGIGAIPKVASWVAAHPKLGEAIAPMVRDAMLFGGLGAAHGGEEAAREAGAGAIAGMAFGSLHPFGRIARAIGGGGIGAMQTYLGSPEAKPEEVAASGLLMGVFGLLGGKGGREKVVEGLKRGGMGEADAARATEEFERLRARSYGINQEAALPQHIQDLHTEWQRLEMERLAGEAGKPGVNFGEIQRRQGELEKEIYVQNAEEWYRGKPEWKGGMEGGEEAGRVGEGARPPQEEVAVPPAVGMGAEEVAPPETPKTEVVEGVATETPTEETTPTETPPTEVNPKEIVVGYDDQGNPILNTTKSQDTVSQIRGDMLAKLRDKVINPDFVDTEIRKMIDAGKTVEDVSARWAEKNSSKEASRYAKLYAEDYLAGKGAGEGIGKEGTEYGQQKVEGEKAEAVAEETGTAGEAGEGGAPGGGEEGKEIVLSPPKDKEGEKIVETPPPTTPVPPTPEPPQTVAEVTSSTPTITPTPTGPVVSTPTPPTRAAALTPKQQKAALIEEINTAIRALGKAAEGPGVKATITSLEGKKEIENAITLEVPGDGKFTLPNDREVLAKFRKHVEANFPTESKMPGPRSVTKTITLGPLAKRLEDPDVAYYKDYVPKPAPIGRVVKQLEKELNSLPANSRERLNSGMSKDGFLCSLGMGVIPKEKVVLSKDIPKDLPEVSSWVGKELSPAELSEFSNMHQTGSFLHAVSENGWEGAFNPVYADRILSEHPDAKPFLSNPAGDAITLVFKDGKGKTVGVILPFQEEIRPDPRLMGRVTPEDVTRQPPTPVVEAPTPKPEVGAETARPPSTFSDDISSAILSKPSGRLSNFEETIAASPDFATTVPIGQRIALENELYEETLRPTGKLGGTVMQTGSGRVGRSVFEVNRPYGKLVYDEAKGELRAERGELVEKMAARKPAKQEYGKEEFEFDTDKEMLLPTVVKDIVNNDLAGTIANETVQNSLDAFPIDQRSKNFDVKIDTARGNHPRTNEEMEFTVVEVSDNASGMSREEVLDHLMKLGAKGKPGTTSRGGYGLAKSSFILAPVRARVETVKDGKLTIAEGTQDQFFGIKKAGKPTIDTQPTDRPNGTKYIMEFIYDESVAERYNTFNLRSWDARNAFEKYFQKGVKIPGIQFSLREYGDAAKTYASTGLDEMPKTFSPLKLKSKGNDVTIYFAPDDHPTTYKDYLGRYNINWEIYNKGLALFNLRRGLSLQGMRTPTNWKVVIDFNKTVGVDKVNYPFIRNRTELNAEIASEIAKVVNAKINKINEEKWQGEKKAFAEMVKNSPMVNGVRVMIPFTDKGEFARAKKLVEANQEVVGEVAELFTSFQHLLNKVGGKKIDLVMTVDPGVHGFRSVPETTGHEFYAINPFAVTTDFTTKPEFQKLMGADFDRDTALSSNLVHTLVHEMAHDRSGTKGEDHGVEWSNEMARLYMTMTHVQLARLEAEGRKFYGEYGRSLEELQGHFNGMGKGGSQFRQDRPVVGSAEGQYARGEGRAPEVPGAGEGRTGPATEPAVAQYRRVETEASVGDPASAVRSAASTARETVDTALNTLTPGWNILKSIKTGAQSLISPGAKSPETLKAAETLGGKLGTMARNDESASSLLKPSNNYFTRNPDQANGFMSAMSTGSAIPTHLQGYANTIKQLFSRGLQALERAGVPLETVRQNYFPGMWTRESRRAFNQAMEEAISSGVGMEGSDLNSWTPDQKAWVRNRTEQLLSQRQGSDSDIGLQYLSRRPFEGSEAFRKPKVFDDIQTALDFGLKPVSKHPIDLVKLKLGEIHRSAMANEAIRDWKESGDIIAVGRDGLPMNPNTRQAIPDAERPAPGEWVKINDKYGTIWYRDQNGQLVKAGEYLARRPVAEILNNYLSSSLYNNEYFGGLYRAYMKVANLLNQAQLGIGSFFHAGFSTSETVFSGLALNLKDFIDMTHGKISPKEFSQGLYRTLTASVENPIYGGRILNEWLNPGSSQDRGVQALAKAVEMAGGRSQLEVNLQTNVLESMKRDWFSDSKIKAAAKSPFAMIELMARPVMVHLVPRQKLAVFGHLVERLVKEKTGMDIQELAADPMALDRTLNALQPDLRQAWNRTDARLGQVVYDRVFMNNAAKSVIQMLIRAPGWSGGTIAEVGGGFKDAAKILTDWAKTGKPPEQITDRMAYTASLLAGAAIANGVMTYALTGEQPEGMDWWAFRTGNKDEYGRNERMMFPTYAKDIMAYYQHPTTTLLHKTHPLLSVISEAARNKDYYGTEVRSPGEDLFTQLGELGWFGIKQFVPFWMRGVGKEAERSGYEISPTGIMDTFLSSPLKVLAPQIGIMPAPAEFGKTQAERLMTEIGAEERASGAATKAEREHFDLKRRIRHDYMAGDIGSAEARIQGAIDQGLLSRREISDLRKTAKETPSSYAFKRLKADDALRVWNLMTQDERRAASGEMLTKMKSVIKNASPEKRNELLPMFREALAQ